MLHIADKVPLYTLSPPLFSPLSLLMPSLPFLPMQEGVPTSEVAARQRKIMGSLPEFCVRDMAVWFRVVVLMRPVLLQGLQVHMYTVPCFTEADIKAM